MPATMRNSLSGEIDLTKFDTPALRRGVLLRAMVCRPRSRFDPVTRTARQARELGLMICSGFDTYLEKTRSSVENGCRKYDLPFSDFEMSGKEFIRSRYEPGLILDLPTFDFIAGPYHLTGRCCLTICFNDSVSKIWARLVLNKIGGRDPFAVPHKKTEEFFGIASFLCDKLIESMRRLYREDFARALSLGPKTAVRFKKLGELTYLGIDESPEIVSSVIDASRAARPRRGGSDFQKLYGKLNSLVDFVDAADAGADAEADEARGAQPPQDFHVYEARTGTSGVFLSRVGTNAATFACASPRSPEAVGREGVRASRFTRPSSALTLMAELASLTAAEF